MGKLEGAVHVCFHPKDPNEASKGVCGRTWSTPVKPTKSRMLSLSPLRTLLPRVMTSNRARHDSELIQLPTIIKVRLLGTRRQSGTVPVPVPDLAGDGDAPPSPSPICPESGTLPRPRPRFGRGRGRSPVPVPDLLKSGTQAVVLEYPQRGRGVLPGVCPITRTTRQLCPTHLSYRTAGNGR